MKDTHKIGDIAEAKLIAALQEKFKIVLLPLGSGPKYDIAVDDGVGIFRVQVKSGRMRDGAIKFNTNSRTPRPTTNGYDQIDYFGVYCPDNRKCYLIPKEEVGCDTLATLRVEPTKNSQVKGVKMASKYELPV